MDLTGKVPSQFYPISIQEKWEVVKKLQVPSTVEFVADWNARLSPDKTYYNIVDRTYTKRATDEEMDFMKYLQTKLLKFTPRSE